MFMSAFIFVPLSLVLDSYNYLCVTGLFDVAVVCFLFLLFVCFCFLFVCLFVFQDKTGFLFVALVPVLELAHADQTGLRIIENLWLLPPEYYN